MKLKKVLPQLSFLMPVQIVEYDNGNEETLFEGLIYDIPWQLAESKLDTDNNGEAISILKIEGKQDPVLNIYVKTKKRIYEI